MTNRMREIDRLLRDKAAAEERAESLYRDSMVAHRWFAEHFGEVMNGKDFSVKCPMATRQLHASTSNTARRCAEMVKRGADIQRQHAENTKRENRWTEKEMSVSESGVEAYLTAANALDFWEYQIRREFGLLTTAQNTRRGCSRNVKTEKC